MFPNMAIERMFRENRELPNADDRMFDFYSKLHLLGDSRPAEAFSQPVE
jgi:hypothetical protein